MEVRKKNDLVKTTRVQVISVLLCSDAVSWLENGAILLADVIYTSKNKGNLDKGHLRSPNKFNCFYKSAIQNNVVVRNFFVCLFLNHNLFKTIYSNYMCISFNRFKSTVNGAHGAHGQNVLLLVELDLKNGRELVTTPNLKMEENLVRENPI